MLSLLSPDTPKRPQASAILCVIVQCLGWGWGEAFAIPFEAKSGFVGFTEDITIFDYSKKEQQTAISAKGEVSPVFRWDGLTTWKELGFLIATEDESRRNVACAGIPKLGWILVDHSDINTYLSQDCWRFSLVSESKLNLQDISRKRASSVRADLMFELMPQKQISTLDPGDVLGGNSGRFGGSFSGSQAFSNETKLPIKQSNLEGFRQSQATG
jgi:hypothetical protein